MSQGFARNGGSFLTRLHRQLPAALSDAKSNSQAFSGFKQVAS
jgi:hypothetical protein